MTTQTTRTTKYQSTKVIPLGSCAFRQPFATSHCKFLHGYRLQAKFWFDCNELDDNNWVVDFGGLKELKAKLEETFDHTTCIWAKDPEKPLFEFMHSKGVIDLRVFDDGVGIEMFANFCLKTANEYVDTLTKGRCWCSAVEVWEHESNSAVANFSNYAVQPTSYSVETVPLAQEASKTPEQTKLNCPPLHYPKTHNSFKDPFAGTSWGNNAKR